MSRQFQKISRIAAIILALVLTAASCTFAASIVSPAENSIAYADSLLISVKLNDQKNVVITVFKEQLESRQEVTKADGSKFTEISYSDFDASRLTAEDLALIASEKRQDENGEAVKFSFGDEIPEFHDGVFATSVTYSNPTSGIGFYTKKLTNVKPGLYKVQVETLDANKNVTETVVSYAAVQEKKEEKQGIFGAGQTGALQFLQNLIKNLFNK